MQQPMYTFLLGAAFMAYLQAAVAYNVLFWRRLPRYGRWATVGLVAGAAVHTIALIVAWLEIGRPLFGMGANTLAYYSWLTVLIYLVLERTVRQKALGFLVAPLISVAVLAAIFLPVQEKAALAPFASSVWLPVHIGVSFASYAALSVAFVSAVLYLYRERQLKSHRLDALSANSPALGTLEVTTYRLVEAGFLLLTITILIGSVGSQQAWGRYWSWEPKQTAALLTWLVYLAYFILRNVTRLSGGQTARCAIAGFVSILVTYFAVNLLLPGQHNFSLMVSP